MIVLPDGDLRAAIEPLRERWDPVMAAGIQAHVTVVYPEEVTDEALLLRRMRDEVTTLRSMPLDARRVLGVDDGRGGVLLTVTDRTGALTALKSRLVSAPFHNSEFPLHATIAHPRTSDRGAEAFAALASDPIAGSVLVPELCWTETGVESGVTHVLERFELAPARVQVVAAVLRRDNRVLLGHRSPRRASFPNLWDLPGGHVEPGEHAADSLRRELLEELGIGVPSLPDVPTLVVSDDTFDVDLAIWFLDEWEGEPVNAAPEEHDEIAWCTATDWSTRPLAHPAYLHLLEEALRRG